MKSSNARQEAIHAVNSYKPTAAPLNFLETPAKAIFGSNIFSDAVMKDRLPKNVKPQMSPISSIMGQIMLVGMSSEGDKTDPIEVRTLADWVVRQRLLTIPGVAQVVTIGGGRKQFQVLVDPEALLKYDVTLEEVERAVAASNENATGGYLDQGGRELLVLHCGRNDAEYRVPEVMPSPERAATIQQQLAELLQTHGT